jgi:hypothetical protein
MTVGLLPQRAGEEIIVGHLADRDYASERRQVGFGGTEWKHMFTKYLEKWGSGQPVLLEVRSEEMHQAQYQARRLAARCDRVVVDVEGVRRVGVVVDFDVAKIDEAS